MSQVCDSSFIEIIRTIAIDCFQRHEIDGMKILREIYISMTNCFNDTPGSFIIIFFFDYMYI
jgi:hypothetical protein